MTKNNILAIVALITIGMTGAVYAETATVEVPFESHGQSCNFDEIAIEYHCTWQGVVDTCYSTRNWGISKLNQW